MAKAEKYDVLRVQFGAGYQAPEGWLNFDASPSVWIERLPLIGRFLKINATRFPAGIRYGDIVRGLPVADDSASAVYASHVLEHLAYDDFWAALRNTYRILKPGGCSGSSFPICAAGRSAMWKRPPPPIPRRRPAS